MVARNIKKHLYSYLFLFVYSDIYKWTNIISEIVYKIVFFGKPPGILSTDNNTMWRVFFF